MQLLVPGAPQPAFPGTLHTTAPPAATHSVRTRHVMRVVSAAFCVLAQQICPVLQSSESRQHAHTPFVHADCSVHVPLPAAAG
jgi:hypothetical protein